MMNDSKKLYEEALAFATMAHAGQTRKSTGEPYISHPILVADILLKAGFSIFVAIAALLHDVVEDTNYTLEDIRQRFGDVVADLVAFNTEDKALSWEQRKLHTVSQLSTATLEQKALVAADKYANLIELKTVYMAQKESLWNAFKKDKHHQRWYFTQVIEKAIENLQKEELPSFFQDYQCDAAIFFDFVGAEPIQVTG